MNGRPRRLAAVTALAATLAVLAWPSAAHAADPPDVTGLTIDAATTALKQWQSNVAITYSPPLEQLPRGVDQSTVVVLRSTQDKTSASAKLPRIQLDLGAAVPDLAGRTRAEADASLFARGLVIEADATAPADWIVQLSKPEAGQLVRFGTRVTVILVAPPTLAPTPTQPPPPPANRVPTAAVAGGVGLLVLVLVAGSTLAVRRSRTRAPVPAAAPHLDVRAHHGGVIAPEIRYAGPDLSLRVVGHRGDPAYTLEEVGGQ
jgi:hypothetical protein